MNGTLQVRTDRANPAVTSSSALGPAEQDVISQPPAQAPLVQSALAPADDTVSRGAGAPYAECAISSSATAGPTEQQTHISLRMAAAAAAGAVSASAAGCTAAACAHTSCVSAGGGPCAEPAVSCSPAEGSAEHDVSMTTCTDSTAAAQAVQDQTLAPPPAPAAAATTPLEPAAALAAEASAPAAAAPAADGDWPQLATTAMGPDVGGTPVIDKAHSTAATAKAGGPETPGGPQTPAALPAGAAATAAGDDDRCFKSVPCEGQVSQSVQSPAAMTAVPSAAAAAEAPVAAEAAAVATAAAGQRPAGQLLMEVGASILYWLFLSTDSSQQRHAQQSVWKPLRF